jgi:hypothetical protein
MSKVDEFLHANEITISGTKIIRKRTAQALRLAMSNPGYPFDDYFTTQDEEVLTLTMDIPEKNFISIVEKIQEVESLMRDPETARLLMEARFISRLKGRNYGTF